MSVHFSSATDLWSTPQDYFDKVAAEFGPFDTDVCAIPENAKAPRFFTKETDGLAQDWAGTCWMNPPYGRTIGAWMKKAYESSTGGGYRRVPRPSPHRHGMVARLRDQGRNPLHSRTAQVRRREELGPVSICACDFPLRHVRENAGVNL